MTEDMFFMLKDRLFMSCLSEISTIELKQQYICNVNFSELPTVNPEIIEFFEIRSDDRALWYGLEVHKKRKLNNIKR